MTPVLRVGARAPVGPTSIALAMASRTFVLEPRPTSVRDRFDVPIGVARCRGVDDEVVGFDRFVALAAPALREAAYGLTRPCPLVLALPPAGRADQSPRFDRELADALGTRAGVPIDLARSRVVRGENTAFAAALDAARELLAATPHVLVGAIDSYLHPDVLRALEVDGRLHLPNVEGGLLPSEGAAFALLGDTRGMPPSLASVLVVASTIERSLTRGSDMATDATSLVRRLVRDGRVPREAWWMTDENPEFARQRTSRFLLPRLDDELGGATIEALPDWCGDVGTATGAVALAVACRRWSSGSAPAATLLVTLQDDGPGRAAFVATAAEGQVVAADPRDSAGASS